MNFFERYLNSQIRECAPEMLPRKKVEKILTVNTAAGHGGAARAAYDMLCVSLRRKGFLTHIACAQSRIENDPYINILKKNPSFFSQSKDKIFQYFGYLDLQYDLDNVQRLDSFQEADVVHLHNLHGGYFNPFSLLYITCQKPTIWTLHDEQSFTGHCAYSFACDRWVSGCGLCPDLAYYPSIRRDRTKFLWNLKRDIYNRSDFTIVVPSLWLKKRVEESMLERKDVRLIYNGIDENVWKPFDKSQARKDLSLPLDKKILLFLADGSVYNPQKGGKYIIEMIKRFRDRGDILFVIVGHDSALGYDNALSRGYVYETSKLIKYYSSADLFIFPTMADNLPFVVMESMACATPVITFEIGGIPEEVEHMKSGYLAKYKDLKDFISGVEIFLLNESFRQEASVKARRKFLQKFTLESCLKNYMDLYQEVYDKRSS